MFEYDCPILQFYINAVLFVIIIIMLHFYSAIFLTSRVIKRHTYTSIRIKKNFKSITKK